MKQKYFIRFIVILTGLLLFCSCSRKTKIGFLMDDSDTGRWLKDKELFIRNVEALGGEVVFRASEGDMAKQFELAKEILNEGVDALVVVPSDLNEAAEIVKLAHQREVPVISYDRIIKNCLLDFYISFDNVQVGELQAKYVSAMCPKGKYAVLGGAVTDNNSFLLRLGQLNIIQPLIERGDIEIVYDQYVDYWHPDEGYRLMKDCLRSNRNVDVVLAANDQLAEGALRALEEAGVEKLPYISGQDADLEACRRIIAGKQAMTVYKPIEGIAQKTAEIVMQMIEEQRIPKTYMSVNNGKKQVPAILLPAMEVNKETIELTVVADGYMEQQHLQKN